MFTRRVFLSSGVGAGLLSNVDPAYSLQQANPQELSGKVIELVVDYSPVNFTGKQTLAFTINGSLPAPTLRLKQGDEVIIRVTNKLAVSTSIHWHGVILPYQMDGVPGISFSGIAAGTTFEYRFKLQQSGTYWYHSHTAMQEMGGMYGALIIEPADLSNEPDSLHAHREHIIQLSDWTDDEPMEVFNRLRMQSNLYNFNRPTLAKLQSDLLKQGLKASLDRRSMFNQMRMSPTDLADLSSSIITYLCNGKTPETNWTGLFKPGERIRLRFINASSNTFYDVRIPGLDLTVVQSDGQNVQPVTIEEFRFGPGETYDVIVEPKKDVYTVFAQSMDRTGYARGTLAVNEGLEAAIPDLDPVEWLLATDMMGEMNNINSLHAMNENNQTHMHNLNKDGLRQPSKQVRHASSEYGVTTDMRVDNPRTNLNDPGVGLRNTGRLTLTLNDLISLPGVITDKRTPGREVELHLTGNMERYSWSLDGLEFAKSTPVTFRHGKRVRVILQNDTMMTHPMHLHGMWSDLENSQGELRVRRHTVPIQPAQRVSFLVTPNDLGRWAWHCHLMFHMEAGMFRQVIVV